MGILDSIFSKRHEKTPHSVPLASALALVNTELNKTTARRIRRPFESPIEQGSITLNDLVQWGSLDIELIAVRTSKNSRNGGRTLLMTGMPERTIHDWPDEAVAIAQKVENKEPLNKDESLVAQGLEEAHAKSLESQGGPLDYRIHNHPDVQHALPSFDDIKFAATSQCTIDAVICSTEIIFYTGTFADVLELQILHPHEQNEYMESKLIQARIPFTDPRMATVLAFFNQKISWQKTRRVLTQERG